MAYRADESPEQRTYKLAAIDFVHKAAQRARERQAFREEQWGMVESWGEALDTRYGSQAA